MITVAGPGGCEKRRGASKSQSAGSEADRNNARGRLVRDLPRLI